MILVEWCGGVAGYFLIRPYFYAAINFIKISFCEFLLGYLFAGANWSNTFINCLPD